MLTTDRKSDKSDTFVNTSISCDTMKTNTGFRASLFAIGAFILTAMASFLIYYNAVIGLSRSTHIWLSFLFVIAVVLHTVFNRKQFT